ncbi:MAG TPA: hypothetical protein VLF89_04090 [Candidatus Saccharimonadales bacterium]|nr:hypothetical protein [Candidatus Saccharimonadales bacterium]
MKNNYLQKSQALFSKIEKLWELPTGNEKEEKKKHDKVHKIDNKIKAIFMPKINYYLRKNDWKKIQELIHEMPATVNRFDLTSKLRNIKNERNK